tara:strand:+ start:39 stop:1298 length:1260 start_codon:yes stop_codon:yes gene_type:complete
MCGLTNGISRYFYYTDKENITEDEVIWTPLSFIIIFSLVLCSVLIFKSTSISIFLLDNDSYSYHITLAILTVILSNIYSVGHSVLIFQEKVFFVNVITIINVLIGALLGIIFVVYMERGLAGIYESALITNCIISIIIFFTVIRNFKFKFNLNLLQKQLRFSLPLMTAVFCFFLIDSSDRYMLKIFLPLSEVGFYNIGYQIGLLMMIFVGGFTAAFPPYYHKNNQNGEGQSICNDVLNIYLLVSLPFLVLISYFGPVAIKILTPIEFHQSVTVISLVAMAYMLKGPYVIFLMGLLMKNKTKWQLYIEIVAAMTNLILNYLLIPIVGREAAALTTVLSYLIMVIISYILVMKVNPLRNLNIIKPASFFITVSFVSCISLTITNNYNLIFLGLFFTIISIVISFFSSKASINNILNNSSID